MLKNTDITYKIDGTYIILAEKAAEKRVAAVSYTHLDVYKRQIQRIGFRKALHKLWFGLGYSDQVRMAHRDFAPRWGYMLSTAYTFNLSLIHI